MQPARAVGQCTGHKRAERKADEIPEGGMEHIARAAARREDRQAQKPQDDIQTNRRRAIFPAQEQAGEHGEQILQRDGNKRGRDAQERARCNERGEHGAQHHAPNPVSGHAGAPPSPASRIVISPADSRPAVPSS